MDPLHRQTAEYHSVSRGTQESTSLLPHDFGTRTAAQGKPI